MLPARHALRNHSQRCLGRILERERIDSIRLWSTPRPIRYIERPAERVLVSGFCIADCVEQPAPGILTERFSTPACNTPRLRIRTRGVLPLFWWRWGNLDDRAGKRPGPACVGLLGSGQQWIAVAAVGTARLNRRLIGCQVIRWCQDKVRGDPDQIASSCFRYRYRRVRIWWRPLLVPSPVRHLAVAAATA
jgi:hypothetical protein